MRKRVTVKKFNRSQSHRDAMRKNLLQALFRHGKIRTTLPKAKFVKPIAEKLITKAGENTNAARNVAHKWIFDAEVIETLFNDIAPRYIDQPGGYTRIVKLGARQGDATEEAMLELIEVVKPTTKKDSKTDSDTTEKVSK